MYTTLISASELAQCLRPQETNSMKPVVVDCRFSLADTTEGERAYAAGHIPHARYAHLDRDLSGPVAPGVSGRHPLPEREVLAQRFCHWGISSETQIIVCDDRTGAIASRLWWLARWLGHAHCAVLDGGLAAWQASGYGLENAQQAAASNRGNCAGIFGLRNPLVQSVEIDTVASDSVLLIDAREAERFRGEYEPIDRVAGHIPGALNAPFQDNVDEVGRFKPKAALHKRFAPLLSEAGDRTLVHYCGSGVTAAHNLLAMAHADLHGGALYAGSFSEWINRDNEQYPVVHQDG
jgi:thiosulfate/3-mercaptopyruvate sulfurtransferase